MGGLLWCVRCWVQIIASEMAVKSRKNVPEGNAELRNAPHLPHCAYTSRIYKRNKMISG